MSAATTPTLPSQPEDAAHRAARRRVRALRGWYVHAFVYAVVIAGLWAVHLATGSTHVTRGGFPWPLAPMFGWGLGLAIHGLVVWSKAATFARDWERRQFERFLGEEQAARR